MAGPGPGPLELGFAELAPGPGRRSGPSFRSKVGGRPWWLGAVGLPGPGGLACPACRRPLAFLLQLYAPRPAPAHAFHRALFLFACRHPDCCNAFRVFRNQLPRKNDFYPYDPPPEEPPPPPPGAAAGVCLQLGSGVWLCRVCGCPGPKACARCHRAHYCSKDHQVLDWKLGHKQACPQPEGPDGAIPDHQFLFPEYEIVIEAEEPDSEGEEDGDVDGVEDCADPELPGSLGEAPEAVLDALAKHESREDRIFQQFKAKTAREPEQIIRYGRGVDPLWISGEGIPQEKDIPPCPCGARREFEFQVMPQLLNYLKADRLGTSLDWGVLAVYTCARSCSLAAAHYTEEFIWKQDVGSA
ncbi:programmed cell death protein 2 [Tachyglossus aculeatus]|uniref:programmed cell death protein 2 n=1 Tax=Tachyglossus aculeatus TaxID=9261 RepID=UPI0018F53D3A|nr:programmed cell death protein 2 [Tachyglossus aculeatus]